MPISKKVALKKFLLNLDLVNRGGTSIVEVKSVNIDDMVNLNKILTKVPKNTVIWQHTAKYHIAAIYLKKGTGRNYSRKMLNLISSGVDSEEKFLEAWNERNEQQEIGEIPVPKKNTTSDTRKKQASFIVVDLNKGEHKSKKINGSLDTNAVDRTHLISAQSTGIENHRGIIIDFDAYLNREPMNEFENKMLDYAEHSDVIWHTYIHLEKDGLHWEYKLMTPVYKRIMTKKWIDDRWEYLWRYD